MIEQTRRGLITGLIAFVASPAIVRASSLMPIKQMAVPLIDQVEWLYCATFDIATERWTIIDSREWRPVALGE